jgi:hypothetical protein
MADDAERTAAFEFVRFHAMRYSMNEPVACPRLDEIKIHW